MYSVLQDTKKYFKKKVKKSRPDNFVFRLHYKITFGILMLASILVSCYEYIDTDGSAIQCMVDQNAGVKIEMVNTFCWFSSTFTLPRYWEGKVGKDLLSYGVGPYLEQDRKVHHAYYQWVPLMLAMQAIMFYLPHYIWKMMEGGRMEQIIAGLDEELVENKETKIDNLAAYMKQRMKYPYEHQVWSVTFLFCELLNLLNVISQIFLTNKFLGGSFYNYGLEVLTWSSYDPEDRVDPMSKIFPRLTKCDFHKFGPSGTIQNYDALCVLGMNILNEKIYVFLWFWFLLLAVVTTVSLMVRLSQLMVPNIRKRLVMLQETGFRPSMPKSGDTERVLAVLSIPDWMILYHMAQCMDKRNFRKLIERMAEEDIGKLYSDNKDIQNGHLGHSPSKWTSKV